VVANSPTVSHTVRVSDDIESVSGIEPLALKVPEACALLRVTRSQLYRMMRAGEIEGFLIGPGQRRFAMSELRAWVEKKVTDQKAQHRGAA
jgi:prophage regulatory protein